VPRRKPTPCPLRSRFGANVAQARISAGLTQEALAEKLGVSARYLQSLEAGEYLPPIPKLPRPDLGRAVPRLRIAAAAPSAARRSCRG